MRGLLVPVSFSALVLFLVPPAMAADSLSGLDPRSMAMGGTGVASVRASQAAQFNPARFAGNPALDGHGGEVAFGRPWLGVRIVDRDDFLGALDQYVENDNEGALKAALDNLERTIDERSTDPEDVRAVTRSANALLDDLDNLSDKPVRAVGSLGLNLGMPGDRFGWGLHVRREAVAGAVIRLGDEDRQAVRDTVNFLDALVDLYETREIPRDTRIPRPVEEFTSTAGVRGALVDEYGISLGYAPPLLEETSFGVTLKHLRVDTVDWDVDLNDAEQERFSLDDQRRSNDDINLDIGVTHVLEDQWVAGLVIRNAIAREYRTVNDNLVEIRPLYRAGLAWQGDRLTVAWDMDLNESPAIGFDPGKQFMAMGVEYKPFHWLALRGGARFERVLQEVTTSFGVGFSSRRARFDIGVSANEPDDRAIALQAGFRFLGRDGRRSAPPVPDTEPTAMRLSDPLQAHRPF